MLVILIRLIKELNIEYYAEKLKNMEIVLTESPYFSVSQHRVLCGKTEKYGDSVNTE